LVKNYQIFLVKKIEEKITTDLVANRQSQQKQFEESCSQRRHLRPHVEAGRDRTGKWAEESR
jgi:hypothetical protein